MSGKIKIGEIKIPKIDMRSEKQKKQEFLDIPDLEKDAEQEIGEQLAAIKKTEKKFKEQWAFDGDTTYYFSVCFKGRKERDEFLEKVGIELECDDFCFYEQIKDKFKE